MCKYTSLREFPLYLVMTPKRSSLLGGMTIRINAVAVKMAKKLFAYFRGTRAMETLWNEDLFYRIGSNRPWALET